MLSLLANLKPAGKTEIAKSLVQIASMLKHRSLVMLFSDLLADPEPIFHALRRLRHGGHDVILFHVLDEAEVHFPFDGLVELEEPETQDKLQIDANQFKPDYLAEIAAFRESYRQRVFSDRHRLRAAGHEHAVRQGADGIPRQPAGPFLSVGQTFLPANLGQSADRNVCPTLRHSCLRRSNIGRLAAVAFNRGKARPCLRFGLLEDPPVKNLLSGATLLVAIFISSRAMAQAPAVTHTDPSAVPPGQATDVVFHGANLAGAKQLWLSFAGQAELAGSRKQWH